MSADDPTVSPAEIEPALPKVVRVPLDRLVLDPNNYRIRDRMKPWPVPRERWADLGVQAEVARALRGQDDIDLWDLMDSMGTVGWRDVTLIQGMALPNGDYLVLDGNRRVVTLRLIQSGSEIDETDLNFDSVRQIHMMTVLIVAERLEASHSIEQVLRHAAGVENWRSRAEAETYRDLTGNFGFTVNTISNLVSFPDTHIQGYINATSVYDKISKRTIDRPASETIHSVILWAMLTTEFCEWLGWNPDLGRIENAQNGDRLWGWLTQSVFEAMPDDTNGRHTQMRRVTRPLLRSQDDVRSVARLLGDPQRLDHWERQRRAELNPADGTTLARLKGEGAAFKLRDTIGELHAVQASLTTEHLAEIDRLADALRGIVAAHQGEVPLPQNNAAWDHQMEGDAAHLSQLTITRYRNLRGLTFERLGRINLLVGANNSGKTSALEALSLLIHQSDPREVLNALRRRARWDVGSDPEWLAQELPTQAEVSAQFGGVSPHEGQVTLEFSTTPTHPMDDRLSSYGELTIQARFGDQTQHSQLSLRVGQPLRMSGKGSLRWICPTAVSSPFSLADAETLQRANEDALKLGVKDRIVQFVRDNLDPQLKNIELTKDHRFTVTHAERAPSPDLSSFGDGLQRAFQIGLLFASAAGGVLLIDELENALHTSLLIDFTKLIQKLAVEFNVQVFITTHSKETVDAFLFNEYRAEDVVVYRIEPTGETTRARRHEGPSLRLAVEAVNLDVRWS